MRFRYNKDAANIAINKGFLFPNVGHKCLMAKDDKKKKVHSRDTPKYTTSDDEGSSNDDNDDLTSLFANLTKDQKKKKNELIESINEKDDLLECQDVTRYFPSSTEALFPQGFNELRTKAADRIP